MKSKYRQILLITSGTLLLTTTIINLSLDYSKISVTDNFDNQKLASIWSKARLESKSISIQSSIKQTGVAAAKITLVSGDKVEDSTILDKSSERDELTESYSLYAIEDRQYEYKFSLFLPSEFPVLPTRLILAQWKQFCPYCSCSENSPILALRYIAGKLFLTLQTSSTRDTLFCSQIEMRNRWLNFKFNLKFSKTNSGQVLAFLNDSSIATYRGITSYPDNCRVLSTRNKYYFKMGLYRDRINQPMTIYLDNYSKIQTDIGSQ